MDGRGISTGPSPAGSPQAAFAITIYALSQLPNGSNTIGAIMSHGLAHWQFGGVAWSLLRALPGIWICSHLSAKVPEHILRRILASRLVLIGTKLLLA
jgi:uncharacterized membrane protein YfcA